MHAHTDIDTDLHARTHTHTHAHMYLNTHTYLRAVGLKEGFTKRDFQASFEIFMQYCKKRQRKHDGWKRGVGSRSSRPGKRKIVEELPHAHEFQ